MEDYFIFNNVDSRTMGIIVNELPPIIKSARRLATSTIDGKDGANFIYLGRDSYATTMQITLRDKTKLDQSMAWLDGPGNMIYSNDLTKFYKVGLFDRMDFERLVSYRKTIIPIMVMDPYRYAVETDIVITTFPATIVNAGTKASIPKLVIAGSGTINITLNGTTFQYSFPNGETSVTVDGNTDEEQNSDAYFGSVYALRNQYMNGPFPTLAIGNNTLSKTGTITSITVKKRTCFV